MHFFISNLLNKCRKYIPEVEKTFTWFSYFFGHFHISHFQKREYAAWPRRLPSLWQVIAHPSPVNCNLDSPLISNWETKFIPWKKHYPLRFSWLLSEVSSLSKDKDKSPAPIPGAAVPTSSSPQTVTNVASPKKLLNRSRKNTESESSKVGGEKTSTSKSQNETDGKSSTTSGVPIGQFHQLPHYYKLYEVIKGTFSNYKVRCVSTRTLREPWLANRMSALIG